MRTHLWKGSTLFRPTDRGKQKGGGLPFFLNNRWCTCLPTIKEWIYCPDTELYAVELRSYYLPRESIHVSLLAVHVPPPANPTAPCAFIAISGDFNMSP